MTINVSGYSLIHIKFINSHNLLTFRSDLDHVCEAEDEKNQRGGVIA